MDTVGWLYYLKGDYSMALIKLKKAAALSPYHPTIRYHLAMAYYKTWRKEKAAEELRKALAISSDFPEAGEARRMLAKLGR